MTSSKDCDMGGVGECPKCAAHAEMARRGQKPDLSVGACELCGESLAEAFEIGAARAAILSESQLPAHSAQRPPKPRVRAPEDAQTAVRP
jgi:hypothetical protein